MHRCHVFQENVFNSRNNPRCGKSDYRRKRAKWWDFQIFVDEAVVNQFGVDGGVTYV